VLNRLRAQEVVNLQGDGLGRGGTRQPEGGDSGDFQQGAHQEFLLKNE
jgi:hypothetical protein